MVAAQENVLLRAGGRWGSTYTILETNLPCLTTPDVLGLCTAYLLPTPRSYSGLSVSFFPIVELLSVVHSSIKKISLDFVFLLK